jgi:hypothetical protein
MVRALSHLLAAFGPELAQAAESAYGQLAKRRQSGSEKKEKKP